MLKKIAIIAAVTASASVASQTCVMQQNTVNRTAVTIKERSQITATVVPTVDGQKKCMVDMRVRIDNEWHTAFGEHVWNGHTPKQTACAVAVKRAEDSAIRRVASTQVVTENVLICNDRDNMDTLKESNLGTVANLAQFRPHPTNTREFWYNGARCRWFLDTVYQQNLKTMQGIICQLQNSKWVVVDKF